MTGNGAVEHTRLFIEALNARDNDSLRELVADDVEFPIPGGGELRGYDGLAGVVRAASDTDLLLAREGAVEISDGSGAQRVTFPVRELFRRDELHGTAVFGVRDGLVTSFEVVSPA